MDVRLSPEQQALRDGASQVVKRLGLHAVGQLGDLERRARLQAAVEESGWRDLRVATEDRTPLASGVEPALVAEELGRGLADVSFLGPTLAAELRRLGGAPASTETETVVLGANLVTLTGADGTGDASGPQVALDAQDCVRALCVVSQSAGFLLAQTDLVATSSGLDLTRPCVVLDSMSTFAPVPGAERVLTTDDLVGWRALCLSLTCADLVGVMRGAVELSRLYALERRQYGVAIGSFQAVQHMLADAFASMEGARSVALHAAWAVDALPAAEALAAAATAKAYCARAARHVCEVAIQVHGGVGNTWECLAHVYLRRALLSSDVGGDAGRSLDQVLEHHGMGSTGGLR
jgi:alkylation response protein AidB-like acyl-CoA dehydrogenase